MTKPPTNAERTAAATSTAQNNAACTAVSPFYWEIGDGTGKLSSGSVGASAPNASTQMPIASATKWIYAAYAVQRLGGVLSADDISFLHFTSGYTRFSTQNCVGNNATTVDDCLAGVAGTQDANTVGKYEYGGGHMQKHASLHGLGAMDNAALDTELQSKLGADFSFQFTAPQLAGGIATTAANYAVFLRKLLIGAASPLLIAGMLDAGVVCTNPATCPTAISNPINYDATVTESWGYGLGHWIESDPTVGDGSFSSAGAFGFYPWVDQSRTHYGVLARVDPSPHAGYSSAVCGRLIRKAWMIGTAQ